METKILIGVSGTITVGLESLCLYATPEDCYKEKLMTLSEKKELSAIELAKLIETDRWYIDFSLVTIDDAYLQSDIAYEINGVDIEEILTEGDEND